MSSRAARDRAGRGRPALHVVWLLALAALLLFAALGVSRDRSRGEAGAGHPIRAGLEPGSSDRLATADATRTNGPAAAPPVRVAPASEPAQPDDAAGLDENAAANAQIEKQLALFDQLAAQEAYDPLWSRAATARLRDALLTEQRELKHADVQCYATFCRAALQYDTSEHGETGFRRLPFVLPWPAEIFVHTTGESRTDGVMYVARENATLRRATL